MTALSEAFTSALQHYQAGQAQQAEEVCRHILQDEPHHAPSLHLLGVLAQQAGRSAEALTLLRRAVVLCPDNADFHFNLGVLLQSIGRKREARSSYQETIRLNRDHADALNNLGHLALHLDQLEEAVGYLRHALRAQPDHGAAYHNLGLVCKRQGKLEEAITCFRQAVRLCPGNAKIHYLFGQTLEEHGQSKEVIEAIRQSIHQQNISKCRRLPSDEAVAAFREAVRLDPDNALYQCALGNVLTSLGQFDEARTHYEQALQNQPDEPGLHCNLGNVLMRLGRLEQAEAHCREAIRLRADFVDGHHNLANVLAAQGRLNEALQSAEAVLRIEPGHAGAHHCRALWWLQQGRLAEGWPEYEWRWKVPDIIVRQCRQPLWDGSPLDGRTILLWAEQGLGDTIQAIRFAPWVKQLGGTVVVECQAPLVRLLSRSAGIDHLVPRGSPTPDVDVEAPLMSLPWLLGITLETIPSDVPYLYVDHALVDQWRRKLEGSPGFKIGIAWQGNPGFLEDRHRSIPLRHFAVLAAVSGVQLISLQKGPGLEQLREITGRFSVIEIGSRLDDFADTAAVMKNLDLVIACDTAVAHLAGAVAVPVWLALPFASDWRWLLKREDSPWYPSMRLFRQAKREDWVEVFRRMANELRYKVGKTTTMAGATEQQAARLRVDRREVFQLVSERVSAEVSMIALSEAFTSAMQHHRAGDARKAEEICRHILQEEPHHAPALHLLGIVAQQAGRHEEALSLLRQAVSLCPSDANYHYNLGLVQQVLGRTAEAIASYRESLRLSPDHASALNNLGHLALNSNQLDEAEECLRRSLRIQPENGAAHHNLGLVCKRRGKTEEALSCFRQAVRLRPNEPMIHFDFGQMLEQEGRFEEAVRELRKAASLQPDNAIIQSALGNVLTLSHKLKEALPHYEQALRIAPHDPAVHSNLGNVLTQLGQPQEAEKYCREAIRLHPKGVAAYHNLANALAAQGRLEEALKIVEDGLRLEPEHPGSRHCRALWRLQLGRFAEGWPEYEWRWKMPDMVARKCREPMWDGSPLNGRTILLWAEQGLGDTLQAIRFVPLVKERGGRVIVECQASLAPLLSRCAGLDQLVARGSPVPEADVQAPLMSLPWLLGITLETLPAEVPYLFPDPALVEKWRKELEGPPSFKIGIAWQGNPLYSGDSMRSIPLNHFAALARLPGVRLFSLQKGIGSEQLQDVADQFYVVDLACRLDEDTGAFMDTAAVLQNLDLVITSDTSVAHLAGALGRPVWVALSIGCDWRFFQRREDNPWYPTMRLFRQKRFGDWDEVFSRMATELATGANLRSGESNGPVDSVRSPAGLAHLWRQALTHFQSGEGEAAERLCRQLLDAEPCHGQALNVLGVLAQQSGKKAQALQYLERAVQMQPKDAGFHYNLGVYRQMLGQKEQAVSSYRQTLRLQPDHAAAHNNLGHALLGLGQAAEAQQHLEQAIRLQPDYAEAYINLGSVYLALGELEKAEDSLKQAVKLRPDHDGAHSRLGVALQRQWRLEEAVVYFRKAVELSPNTFAAHHNNLGLVLAALGRYEEALACYEEAIRLDPNGNARFSRAMIWLLHGDFERGWGEYEYRWPTQPGPRPSGPQPLWDGSPLNGRTILLWAEQGLGDTIQFIRYASLVKQRGGTVVVHCQVSLAKLFANCSHIDRVVPYDTPLPDYDVHAPLMSLPHIFGTTLRTIPAVVPYLEVNNELVERWQRELNNLSKFRVGIAWQGNPNNLLDRNRSIPLCHFAALARVPGVQLISLQRGPGHEQLREIAGRFSVIDLGSRLDDFADIAAVLKNLDLVVCCDTAFAHLAGALALPVWVALPSVPEWRWLLDREDSPWYPSMRLFRQQRRGDWEEVFLRMADELRRKVGAAAPADIYVPVAPGELIDKITILEIKLDRIQDSAKQANVRAELAELTAVRERNLSSGEVLVQLTEALKAVNEALWQIEDELRECERAQDFGPRFIELARSVYQNNDRRAALKRQINELLGSRLIEEKSYAPY